MAAMKKVLVVLSVLIGFSAFSGLESANAWKVIAKTYDIFAVGEPVGSEMSYLYTIDPLTGVATIIGDTGFNKCRGLDFSPEGKLKALCEQRNGEAVVNKGEDPVAGFILELDPVTALAQWANPHGASNSMSDITFHPDGRLFSYENIDTDRLHIHEDPDFQASVIGEPGIEADYHAMALGGVDVLKVAANVDGVPGLYAVDTKTGEVALDKPLILPDEIGAVNNQASTRELPSELTEFLSMDNVVTTQNWSILKDAGGASVSTKDAQFAFRENDADFAALIAVDEKEEKEINGLVANNNIGVSGWIAISLIEAGTGRVDYIVPIQGDLVARAIALRARPVTPIPTLSEWGLIAMAGILGIAGLLAARRRKADQA